MGVLVALPAGVGRGGAARRAAASFASGLALQGVAAALGPGAARDRITATVEDLDETIGQIRASVFQLQRSAPSVP